MTNEREHKIKWKEFLFLRHCAHARNLSDMFHSKLISKTISIANSIRMQCNFPLKHNEASKFKTKKNNRQMMTVLNTFVPIRVFDKVSTSNEMRWLHEAMAVILATCVTLDSRSLCGAEFSISLLMKRVFFSTHFYLISQRLKLNFSFSSTFPRYQQFFLFYFPFRNFFPFFILFPNEFSLIYPQPLYLPCAICPKIGSVIVSVPCPMENC